MTSKSWGIDLAGRTMRYAPWPLDNDKKYRAPAAQEIEDIYGISGEAVRETLLYFEECGGSTADLIKLLNTYALGSDFSITRDELLDEKRRYTNEYFFYFIMFTKKVIGRNDFHFGENNNDQLSCYHKIYEKGNTSSPPWGRNIKDFSGFCFYAPLALFREKFSEELLEFLYSILAGFFSESYTPELVKKAISRIYHWFSWEFCYLAFELFKIISNDNLFQKNSYFLIKPTDLIGAIIGHSYTALGYVVSNIPNIVYNNSLNIEYRTIKANNRMAQYQFNFSQTFRNQIGKYQLSVARELCLCHLGVTANVPFFVSKQKQPAIIYHSRCLAKGENCCLYEIIWPADRKKINISAAQLLILITACLLIIGLLASKVLAIIASVILLTSAVFIERKNSKLKSDNEAYSADVLLQKNETTSLFQKLVTERDGLELEVKERTSELTHANARLQELDKLKSDFFANVSHELRTPLTLIISPLETLLKNKKNHKEKKMFMVMLANARKLAVLINNLLDFSKIEAKKIQTMKKTVPIVKLVKEYIAMVKSAAQSRNIKLAFTSMLNPDLPVCVDVNLFEKAVFNLLANALKFTPCGGIIKVLLSAEKNDFFLTVKDSGIGIPEDKQEMIFERFSQIDTSSARKYEGTGIGLFLVKEIAALHNGDISVKSSPGHGSEFTLRLPIVSEEIIIASNDKVEPSASKNLWSSIGMGLAPSRQKDTAGNNTAAKTPASKKRNTVLIVDDNREMLDYLTKILCARYNIYTAENGRQALELLAHEKIDLLVSDIMMPEMDGSELVTKIRADFSRADLPIILLTAKAQMSDKLCGFAQGATDYICKPFNTEELLARINSQIKLKIMRDELQAEIAGLRGKKKKISGLTEMKVRKVHDFIGINFMAALNREELARTVELSPDHLGRMFLQLYGEKISEYINRLRIKEAADRLVNKRERIIDIAYSLGFENISTFNSTFLALKGITPREFRKKPAAIEK